MRLMPSQIAVRLICGKKLPGRPWSLIDRIKAGHEMLTKITGQDFGYDLQQWHSHLKESREGGYTWGRHIQLPKIMEEALESRQWQDAVKMLVGE
jgi:hypothetical protein